MRTKIEISGTLRNGIMQTWGAIGSDLEEGCRSCGEKLDNETALEACCDADRLAAYGDNRFNAMCRKARRAGEELPKRDGPSPDEEFKALIKEHGYPAVMKALAKEIKLA